MLRAARTLLTCERGASAVEFAIVGPVFVALVMAIICFGTIFVAASGVQQLAAEAARASVAGLSDTERGQIAQAFITAHAPDYAFIDATKLQVSTSSDSTSYDVQLNYDMSGSFVYQFAGLLPLPSSQIHRAAAIQDGGF